MKGTAASSSSMNEKRVDVCAVLEPKGILYQFGEAFPFFFDSGAECSLIKEKLAVKLAGKRFNNLVILKGIGTNVVHCNLQILSTIQICQFNLEIMFNVVMDEHLKHDIMIGREILALYNF